MKLWMRVVAVVVLASTLGVPFGIAAEGYVCASGARMDAAAVHACERCALRGVVLDASARRALAHRSIGRACCTYVRATALPEAVASASASHAAGLASARAAAAPVVIAHAGIATATALALLAPPGFAPAAAPDPGGPGSAVAARRTDLLQL